MCDARSAQKSGVEFPTANPRFQEWVDSLRLNLTLDDLKHHGRRHFFVCFEHFPRADWIIENNVITGVRQGSVPILIARASSRLSQERIIENSEFPKFLIVERSCLEQLFKFCYEYGQLIGRTLDFTVNGSNIFYNYYCAKCGSSKGETGHSKGTRKFWSAHTIFEPGAGKRMTTGNLQLVTSAILAPISYTVRNF